MHVTHEVRHFNNGSELGVGCIGSRELLVAGYTQHKSDRYYSITAEITSKFEITFYIGCGLKTWYFGLFQKI